MEVPDIIIAVDGYSSTGKSTFARLIAKEFSFLYLDSGAMYRGVTLFALENDMIRNGDEIDTAALEPALAGLDLHFNEEGKTCIGDRVIEKEIRTMRVSESVSPIATLPFVRNFVDGKLHQFSAAGRVVMDGRDIGTTVFPNAQIKVFMVADDRVRAQRRYDEMVSKGQHPKFEEVLDNLRERDYIDSHRETSPLKRAPDAFVMDNSDMTIREEIAWIRGLIQGRFGILE